MTDSVRLPVDAYLDCRHPAFAWFEALGVITARDGWVSLSPHAVAVILALAGVSGLEPDP